MFLQLNELIMQLLFSNIEWGGEARLTSVDITITWDSKQYAQNLKYPGFISIVGLRWVLQMLLTADYVC